ncbi:cysteine peptidase family C39 domain-containing protein [Novispirillum sp. DQ9]|uniref:cysteine peptidase family C39 domain-containing protein n=1 Tax=Novispirillum sp. DQ9 TaxID=3398612 RepID=UPI003C7C7ABA
MSRTPALLQMEPAECGAVALAIILAHHGRWVPVEDLREACGVSRDGSRAAHVLAAAQAFGLTAEAFRCEPDDLAALPMPAIVFWEMNHFLVVEGRRGGSWRLNDPARGRLTIDAATFHKGFTGIALTFRPGPGFTRGGRAPSAWRGLRAVMGGGAVPVVAASALAVVLPGLAIPAAALLALEGTPAGAPDTALHALGVGAVLAALATALHHGLLARLEERAAATGATAFLRRALRLPLGFLAQRSGGEVAARVQAVERVAALAAGPLAAGLVDGIAAGVFLAALTLLDPPLAALAALAGGGILAGTAVAARRLAAHGQRRLNEATRLRGLGLQGLQMIDTLKADGAEGALFDRLAALRAGMLAEDQAAAGMRALLAGLPAGLSLAALAAVAVAGAEGGRSMGDLVAALALTAAMLFHLARLARLAGPVQALRADLRLLDDALAAPLDAEFQASPAATAPAAPRLRGRLELRDVTFGYSPLEPPLLREVSLVVEPGRRVGVAGASGSGKSTLGRLASGLARPWSGSVLLDGVPLPDLPRAALRRSVAVVDQTAALFEGTLRDNLTLWDDTLPDERLGEAARIAALHDFIASRPGGAGAPVAEGGRNFSGGQVARLEIARAVVRDPALLILDEATAALDAETERTVAENLRRVGCATLVIAHRWSALRDCDEIVVLDGGRIVQRGAPADLLAAPGPFRALMEG